MPAIPQHVADKAARIQHELNSTANQLRDRGEYTPEAMQKRMAGAYAKAKTEMDTLQERWQSDAASTAKTMGRDIFGTASVAGADAISTRDAADRAARLESPQDAMTLFRQAEENGDAVLSRAIAQRAYNERGTLLGSGWSQVLDSFLESRPLVADKIAKLEDARRDDVRTGMTAAITFSLNKPRELENLADYRINALAAE